MAEEHTGRTLRQIVRILAGRFVAMLFIIAIVVAGVGTATHFAPRSYRSEVGLLAKASRNEGPLDPQAPGMREQVSLFVSTQRELLQSDYVIASALLALRGEKMPAPSADKEALAAWDAKVQTWISGDTEKGLAGHREYLEKVKKRVEIVTPGGPDATFSQTMTVRIDWPEESTDEARKAAKDQNLSSRQLAARRAHDFAQRLVDAYINRYTQLEIQQSRRVSEHFTQDALVDAKAQLDLAQEDMKTFTGQVKGDLLHIINLTRRYSAGVETGVSRLTTDFQADLDRTRKQLAEVDQLLAEVNKQVAGIQIADRNAVPAAMMARIRKIVVPDAILLKNKAVDVIQGKTVQLQLQLNNLLSRYNPEYQEVKDLRQEIGATWIELFEEMDRIRRRLEQEKAVLVKQQDELRQIVDDHTRKADDLAQKTAEYERFRSNVLSAQQIYDEEKKRVFQAATAEKLAANPMRVRVIDEATMPDAKKPRTPLVWVNLLVAAAAGVLLALVYAFLADHFDQSIKSIDDAERYLDAPVLASVPKLGGRIVRRGRGEDLPRAWLKPSSEQLFAGMWAALYYSGEPAGKRVLVCSADRKEGASTISAGLALAGGSSAASASVALVDLNLRNPMLHRLLGLGGEEGVSQIVLEGLDVDAVRHRVNEGLDFYPAGAIGPNALALLRDDRLRSFLSLLAERYDHVLVDAAPINRFPDAKVLAKLIPDVVLVAHTEHTPRQALALAKKHLESGEARVAGVVLNLRTYPIPKFLYRRV